MGEKAELKARIKELEAENDKLHDELHAARGNTRMLQIFLATFAIMVAWYSYG